MARACCVSVCQDCDELTPNIVFRTGGVIQQPIQNGAGATIGVVSTATTITAQFFGLIQRYRVRWLDLPNDFIANNQFTRANLAVGVYTVQVTSIANPSCTWTYEVRVEAVVQATRVLYTGNRTEEVPAITAFNVSRPDPTVFDYRVNSNRILQTRVNNLRGNNISFEIEELNPLPVVYLWQDYRQYGPLPLAMVQQPYPQTATVINYPNIVSPGIPVQRPPIIVGPTNERIVTVNLVATNGNGWVKLTRTYELVAPTAATATTAATPGQYLTLGTWIYVKQEII